MFDQHSTRRPSGNGKNDGGLDQVTDLRDEVPEVEDVIDRATRAATEEVTETESRGCGCWG